jgi:hypothetical protein
VATKPHAELRSTATLSIEARPAMRAPRDPALRLRFGLLVRNALSGPA